MSETNFPAPAVARLGELPDSEIVWFNQGKHPKQGIIAISSTTGQAIEGGGRDTMSGISTAEDSSHNALHKSYRHTRHALGTTVRHVGKALGLEKHPVPTAPPSETKTP
jgi:hypothetical protein